MTRSIWWLIVDSLATYRLTMLVVKDTITEPLRMWLGKPWSYGGTQASYSGVRWRTFQLTGCPWCISIWLAGGVVALTRLAPGVWQYAGMALALSALAGYLAER